MLRARPLRTTSGHVGSRTPHARDGRDAVVLAFPGALPLPLPLPLPLSLSGREATAGRHRYSCLDAKGAATPAPALRSLLATRCASARRQRGAEPSVGSSSCPPNHRQTGGPSRSTVP